MAIPEVIAEQQGLVGIDADYKEKFGFHDPESGYAFKAPKGLRRELVEQIAELKNEPDWMREVPPQGARLLLRAAACRAGAAMLSGIDFDNIYYYIRATEKQAESWDDVPADIKDTWDKLGIPEAEKKYLAGVGAQYESEVVYHNIREELEPSRASSSSTWTRACASTRSSSSSTSGRSSRRTTTSSRR